MLQMAGRMGVLGTETAFEVLARANALAAQGRSIINLGIGQPDFPTPDHIVEAGRKALADGHHGYTPANGIPPLRAAVAADLFRRYRVEVSPDLVLVVPGGKVTMFFAILMFGEPGVEILYPNPSFPIYESVIRFSGATPVPIPLYESAGFSFNAEEVLEKITPQTRLLIINSPANPTGGVVPREELDRLVAGLEKHPHVAVMSDEIYGEILYDGAEHVSLLGYPELKERVVLLDARSFQSRLLDEAGIATIAGTSFGDFGENYVRFSYAASREAIEEALERIRRFLGNLPRSAAAEG